MTSGGGAPTTLPTVHRDEVDGVPVFWVDSGRPTLAALLLFRCGIADETLPTTGWTHLVEHLALHGRDESGLSVNGSTSLLLTDFQAHGPADEVAAFLGDLTRWLAEPDLARLAAETRVLEAEAAYRGIGPSATALLQRYGAQGAGLAGYTEPGLLRATAEVVSPFAAERFGAGNAALVLDGPPPSELRLALRDGERRTLPTAPRSTARLPAAYATNGGLVLSGVVERSLAATVLPDVLQDMLRRDLREATGGAYAPWSSYELVGSDTAVVFAGSDVVDALLPTVVHYARSGLEALAARGPFDGVVDRAVAARLQAYRDPYQAVGFAYRSAREHLLTGTASTPEQMYAETASVTSADVHALVAGFAATELLGVPRHATWNDELPVLRMPEGARSVTGTRFRSRDFPAARDTLVVSDDGIAVGQDGQDWVEIRRDDVAGVFVYPDGRRDVVDRDGWTLVVEPTMWAKGAQAGAAVDAMAPHDLLVPARERDAGVVPLPRSLLRRWWAWALTYGESFMYALTAVVVLLIGLAAGIGAFGLGGCVYLLYRAVTARPGRTRAPS